MFTVVTPNTDRTLLTIQELRIAVGLASDDASQDSKLTTLGDRVSSMITGACKITADGATPPTMRSEAVQDDFRLRANQSSLVLSRRPVTAITSIIADDETLLVTDYEIDKRAGIVRRLWETSRCSWSSLYVVINYTAGWATVPADLKAIAAQLAGGYWLDDGVDPMEKSFTIPGVITTERWVDSSADAQMPKEIMAALERGGYVNHWLF